MTRPSAATTRPPALSPWSRIYGFGSIFAKTVRDSRRATSSRRRRPGAGLHRCQPGDRRRVRRRPSREIELVNLVSAVPPILQGLAGQDRQRRHAGRLPPVQVRRLLPARRRACGRSSPCRARSPARRSAAASSSSPRPAGRAGAMALEKLFGHVLVARRRHARRVRLDRLRRAARSRRCRATRSASRRRSAYTVWLGLLALVAGALAFAWRRSSAAARRRHRRLRHVRRLHPQRLPDGRSPSWPRSRTSRGGAGRRPPAPRRPVRLAVGRPRGGRDLVLLVVGVEAFVRRDIGVTSTVPTPRMPRALARSGGPVRPCGRRATSRATIAWGLGLGAVRSRCWRRPRGTSWNNWRTRRSSSSSSRRSSRTSTIAIGRRLPAAPLRRVRADPRRPCRGDLRRRLGVRRDVRPARDAAGDAAGAGSLGRRRRARAAGQCGPIVAMTAIGISIGAATTDSEVVTPLVGTLVLGLYAAALAGVGMAIGGVLGTRIAGPAVVLIRSSPGSADHWAAPRPTGRGPPARADDALRPADGRRMGPGRDRSSLALAVGGVAIGAWGFARRDLRS